MSTRQNGSSSSINIINVTYTRYMLRELSDVTTRGEVASTVHGPTKPASIEMVCVTKNMSIRVYKMRERVLPHNIATIALANVRCSETGWVHSQHETMELNTSNGITHQLNNFMKIEYSFYLFSIRSGFQTSKLLPNRGDWPRKLLVTLPQ